MIGFIDTGRDLLAAGVIEGGDTLPEAALVKLMWVLANEKNREKAAALMQSGSQRGMHEEERLWTIRPSASLLASRSTSDWTPRRNSSATARQRSGRSPEHSGEFFRYLRATVSEMGGIDRAALEEMKHHRKFQYYAYDTTCLVENDEEPPTPINDEALSVCLTIGKMFGMTPVPQVAYHAQARNRRVKYQRVPAHRADSFQRRTPGGWPDQRPSVSKRKRRSG